jgi:Phosphoribosylformylglycinamidine (FGAM) synthase, synthetase domain
MAHRIEVTKRAGVPDAQGSRLLRQVRDLLEIPLEAAHVLSVYVLDAELDRETLERLGREVFADPVLEVAYVDRPAPILEQRRFDFVVEVGFRPGVTDNEGRTAQEAVALVLGCSKDAAPRVHTATQVRLAGAGLGQADAERIAQELLANALIHRVSVLDQERFEARGGFEAVVPRVTGGQGADAVETVALPESLEALEALSRARTLALSGQEMRAIRAHYLDAAVRQSRARMGLPEWPTDVELEALAQTWSEHCKHKIFNADITLQRPDGTEERIRSLF